MGGFGEDAAQIRAALARAMCAVLRIVTRVASVLSAAPFAAAAGLPDFSASDGTPVEIRADQVSLDRRLEIYEAYGEVHLIQADRELSADWVIFNSRTGRGVASGNVRLTRGRDVLNASFLDFDADDLEGVVYDGALDAPDTGFQMRGREIARTGEDTYHFEDGVFTTCVCPEPDDRKPWQIEAGEADLEVGGYGTARNTTFDILEVPVLWFPWMIYPLKTDRQSGFLFPEIGFSRRNGSELGLPFFWAAHDQLNVTLTPRWLDKRGFKGDVDLEYVLGEKSRGSLFGAFLIDRSVDEESLPPPLRERERWTVFGKQDLWLPADLRLKADFAAMSDNDYAFDFIDLGDKQKDRYLESQAFVFTHFGDSDRFGSMLSIAYADDLQSPDPQDRDRFLLQRLPRIEFSMLPEATPGITTRWIATAFDAEYTMFRPRDPVTFGPVSESSFFDTGIDGIPDSKECGTGFPCSGDSHNDGTIGIPGGGSEGNGRFDEGEALADRGHRIDLWPRLSVPLRIFDRIELLPEAGWRETLYFTDQQDSATRGFATGRVDARTRLRGHVAGLLHLIEPRVGYVVLTRDGQFGNPRFVPETFNPQLRLREIEVWNRLADPSDRIRSFHGTVYGVEQRFFREAAGRAPRLLADVLIAQQYDVQRSEIGSLFFDGRVYTADRFGLRFQLGVDPDPEGNSRPEITEGLAQAAWSTRVGHELSLEYRYLRDIPTFFEDFSLGGARLDGFREISAVNQVSGATKFALTKRWTLRYRANYSFDENLLLSHSGSLEYFSKCKCWGIGVEISDDRNRGVRYNVLYRFVGLGKGEGRGWRLLDER